MFTLKFWKSLATQVVAYTAAAAAGLVYPVIVENNVSFEDAGKALAATALVVILKGLAASYVGDPTSPNFKS